MYSYALPPRQPEKYIAIYNQLFGIRYARGFEGLKMMDKDLQNWSKRL